MVFREELQEKLQISTTLSTESTREYYKKYYSNDKKNKYLRQETNIHDRILETECSTC